MSQETEERVAELAVARYGADPARVQVLVQDLREARARGDAVDLLDLFARTDLLSASQIGDLRFGLDKTQIDGHAAAGSGAAATDPSLNDLRMLGAYHILRRLGEGGMGAVFLGYHEKDNRQVAIKVLSSEHARHQTTLDRFHREAKSGALLNHPNVVRNLEFGQDQATSLHYLVLEYVEGCSAQQLLERFGRLTVGDAVHVVLDVARALEHAHSRNIVHRDIKPGNILVARSGLAKLADLGLAKRTDEASHLTLTRQGFGTPYYMPYEQAMNARRADARSDIYALGATLYHLVAGEVPFPGVNSLEIVDKKQLGVFLPAGAHNPAVSEELDGILRKMLARDPQDRYQTVSECIVDLERSNLAASVPSFVDPLDAYSDPLVRERLTAPAQATQMDMREGLGSDFWYVVYRDAHGNICKAKMNTVLLSRRLRTGRLPAQTKASRSSKGPFAPVQTIVELRQPVAKVTNLKRVTARGAISDPLLRWWWMLTLTLIVSLLTLSLLVFFMMRE